MEHLEPHSGIFEPRYGFAIEAIDALDLCHQAYIDSCEIYTENSHDPQAMDLVCSEANLYTNAYRDTLTTLIPTTPLEEFLTIGTRLGIEQDTIRNKELNDLLGRLAIPLQTSFETFALIPNPEVDEETIVLGMRVHFTKLFVEDVFRDTTSFVRLAPQEN